jgi:hypothetical protein
VFGGLRSLDAMVSSTDGSTRTIADTVPASRLDVADLGQAESVSLAWQAMEAADPEGVALLQLHHADGARVTELGSLEGMGAIRMRRRLEVARDRLRVLPEVRMALAG